MTSRHRDGRASPTRREKETKKKTTFYSRSHGIKQNKTLATEVLRDCRDEKTLEVIRLLTAGVPEINHALLCHEIAR